MASSVGIEMTGTVALMFPGQGSQFPGMGMDLATEYSTARQLFEQADDILGYSLTGIMSGEQGDELHRTVHTQPAVFVHSMALFEVLRGRYSLSPTIAGGHSLGEYSALCAAGVLSFQDALEVIRIRAQGMDQAQEAGTCGMAAVIGLKKEQVLDLVETLRGDDILEAANFNAPDQVVVSGSMSAVNRVVEAAGKQRRTKAVVLPVSSAFHTSLMEPARELLRTRLQDVDFREPTFPVVANLTAKPYPSTATQIREHLLDQIVSPVLWEGCVETMKETEPEKFIEVGPGKVLCGLLRRIDRKLSATNVSDMQSIAALEKTSE